MSEAAVAEVESPHREDLDFERLYRSSRDDVYAYAAGLLRDRVAAVLAPVALLALLIWLARRTWVRTQRKQALRDA